VLALTGGSPHATLAAVMVVTMVLANVITTKAAAVLMFPVGVAAAANLSVAFMPFAIAIIVGAACSLATPIGYQTNLMVYGPGGYRTTDFLRLGVPLSVLVLAVSLTVILAEAYFLLPEVCTDIAMSLTEKSPPCNGSPE